jgi:ubiquitin carboxyl-terminal hydrolase 4/11/15
LDTLVDFPLDALDMSKHCASARPTNDTFVEDGVQAMYDLFAVTNHYGRMGFGHYTAFARRWDEKGISNEWALFDDSTVQSVGDGRGRAGRNDGVVTSAAYVLFYRRRIN